MRVARAILTSLSLIVVIAFAVRLGTFYIGQRGARLPVITAPPYGYETGAIAASIATGHGYSSPLGLTVPSGATAWLTPVYPYLLAGIFKIYGVYSYTSEVVIITLNCFFSALTCIPIYFIGKRIGGTSAGAMAAWIWTFYAQAIITPIQWIWDTSLAALLVSCILWATIELRDESRESRRAVHWVAYGALWAFALMVNASIASVAPFALLWLAWALYKEDAGNAFPRESRPTSAGTLANTVRLPALALLTMVIGCAPWTARNLIVFHHLIPLRSNFGLELWLGNNADVPDTWAGWLHPSDNAAQRAEFLQMGEIAYMREKQHEALQFMASHPVDVSRFLWRRFVENWTTTWDPIQDVWRAIGWQDRVAFVSNLIVVFAGLFGALLLFRTHNEFAWPMVLFPLLYPVVYYVTHPSRRYRHPIDPVLIILTAVALAYPFASRARAKQLSEMRNAVIPISSAGSVAPVEPTL